MRDCNTDLIVWNNNGNRRINFMGNWSSWFGLISATSAICILAEFFIPKGKIGKSMNIILSMFVLSAFVGAINTAKQSLNLKPIKFSEFLPEKNAEKFTAKIEKQTQELVNKNLETAIRRELIDFKMNPKKIEIFTDKNEDNCIVMIRCKIYTNRSELISAENAKNMIEKNLGICTEFIEV